MHKNKFTTLDLLRHGELETTGLFCANPDEPLSEKGFQDLTRITKNMQWDVLASSPYKRCCSFVKVLKKERNDSVVMFDSAFQEMNFGRWEGIPTKQIWQDEPEKLNQLWQAPQDFIAPEGESMQAFTHRVNEGLKALISNHRNQSILLVTHAGVIRSILSMALEINPISALKINVGYAQMIRLHCYPDGEFSLQTSIQSSVEPPVEPSIESSIDSGETS